jgi:hypothetical protein
MDWTQNGPNPEWDSTPNGLNPRMGLNPDWTQPRPGLNPEWTQPRLGLNPDWDWTQNGTQPRISINLEYQIKSVYCELEQPPPVMNIQYFHHHIIRGVLTMLLIFQIFSLFIFLSPAPSHSMLVHCMIHLNIMSQHSIRGVMEHAWSDEVICWWQVFRCSIDKIDLGLRSMEIMPVELCVCIVGNRGYE